MAENSKSKKTDFKREEQHRAPNSPTPRLIITKIAKEKDKYHISLICGIENRTQMHQFTEQRETHRYENGVVVTKGEKGGREVDWELGTENGGEVKSSNQDCKNIMLRRSSRTSGCGVKGQSRVKGNPPTLLVGM